MPVRFYSEKKNARFCTFAFEDCQSEQEVKDKYGDYFGDNLKYKSVWGLEKGVRLMIGQSKVSGKDIAFVHSNDLDKCIKETIDFDICVQLPELGQASDLEKIMTMIEGEA